MKKNLSLIVSVFSLGAGVALGYAGATLQHEAAESAARYENYTDRGRICLEAAAMLRANQQDESLKFLEHHALCAIRGVPMCRSYTEMLPKSQELLISARRYENKFDDVDFGLDDITRPDVPLYHPRLSETLKSVTAVSGG